MLRPVVRIIIKQLTSYITPIVGVNSINAGTEIKRNQTIVLNFCEEFKVEKSWENHTDTATVKFPKNVQLRYNNKPEFLFKQTGTYSVFLGGTLNVTTGLPLNVSIPVAPLLMRGDQISIFYGYYYYNNKGKENSTYPNTYTTSLPAIPNVNLGVVPFVSGDSQSLSDFVNVFNGFISKVYSDVPIQIDCEDNFYLLKKTPISCTSWQPTKQSNGTGGSLTDLADYLLDNVNKLFPSYPKLTRFKGVDSITAQFSLGYLDIDYETISCAQVLHHLKQKYGIESYFKNSVLYFGFPFNYDAKLTYKNAANNDELRTVSAQQTVYPESENQNSNSQWFFDFQNNIKNESLEYTNKDDIFLSTVVRCQTITDKLTKNGTNVKTKEGENATKIITNKVYVYSDIKSPTGFSSYLIDKIHELPTIDKGGNNEERHECIYPVSLTQPAPTVTQMANLGIAQLKKYYYTGFKGSFKTFGLPFIQFNDNVNLLDEFIADRSGQYKVKKVIYTGSTKGIEQDIHLDYKQSVPLAPITSEKYMA